MRNGCVVNAKGVKCDVTLLAFSHPFVHAKFSLLYHFTGLFCVILPGGVGGGVRHGCVLMNAKGGGCDAVLAQHSIIPSFMSSSRSLCNLIRVCFVYIYWTEKPE